MKTKEYKFVVDVIVKDYGDGSKTEVTVEEIDEAVRNWLDNSDNSEIGQYMIDVDVLPDEKDIENLQNEIAVLKILNKKGEKK